MIAFLNLAAAYGRFLLVAGLVAGVLLPGVALTMRPWLPEMIAGLLLLTAVRIGPKAAMGGLSDVAHGLRLLAVYQLVLPLTALGLCAALGVLHHPLAFAVVLLLALGKMVAEVYSALVFIAVFWVAAIAGGLGFVLVLDSEFPLVGGYTGVYGLIGAFTFLMWMRADKEGLGRSSAFVLIGALLAVQLLFALFNGEFGTVVADFTGFLTGLLLSFVVSPGGWGRLLGRLRQR